jgi:hypothetical protein
VGLIYHLPLILSSIILAFPDDFLAALKLAPPDDFLAALFRPPRIPDLDVSIALRGVAILSVSETCRL